MQSVQEVGHGHVRSQLVGKLVLNVWGLLLRTGGRVVGAPPIEALYDDRSACLRGRHSALWLL